MKELLMSNNLVFLDVKWFNATHSTGIIVCEDMLTNEIKCYIDGVGRDGESSEKRDIQKILAHGSYFPNASAEHLFPQIDFEKGWVREHPEYFL